MTGVQTCALPISLGVSLVTGVLFGLVPALRASRIDLNDALKNLGRVTGTRSRHGLTNFLVTAELTLAFVLVVGAGLLGQSFRRLVNVDPGFEPLNVFTLRTVVLQIAYPKHRGGFTLLAGGPIHWGLLTGATSRGAKGLAFATQPSGPTYTARATRSRKPN